MNINEKLQALANLVSMHRKDVLLKCHPNYPDNCLELDIKTSIKPGKKYTKIDLGSSGKLMVDNQTEIIYGIKGYGKVHKGHSYGTLDTINQYYWGTYYPFKKGV
jgi:hypothetical protein